MKNLYVTMFRYMIGKGSNAHVGSFCVVLAAENLEETEAVLQAELQSLGKPGCAFDATVPVNIWHDGMVRLGPGELPKPMLVNFRIRTAISENVAICLDPGADVYEWFDDESPTENRPFLVIMPDHPAETTE